MSAAYRFGAGRHVMCDDPTPEPGHEVVKAVAIAALTTMASALATWAVDELRERYGRAAKTPVVVVTDQDGAA